jgi:hypothetical protein
VVAAEERVEWCLAWGQVASLRLGGDEVVIQARSVGDNNNNEGGGAASGSAAASAAGGAVSLLSGGLVRAGSVNAADVDLTKRFVKCQSAARAEAVAARVREVCAAARAAGWGCTSCCMQYMQLTHRAWKRRRFNPLTYYMK